MIQHHYFTVDGVTDLAALRLAAVRALDHGESSIVHDHAEGKPCTGSCTTYQVGTS